MFFDMYAFLKYKPTVIINSENAMIQKGIANFVRNARGIPITVIPASANNATIPKQTLWQTCHEPKILAAPETLPVLEIIFSLMFLIILTLH